MTDNGQLFDAIRGGDLCQIRKLITLDSSLSSARDESGSSAVITAVYYGRTDIARLLVDAGADVDVFAAAALGMIDRLNELIRDKPNLIGTRSPDGWTPLALTAFFGQAAAAERLIHAGADTEQRSANATSNMPLHAAIAGTRDDLTVLLLDAGANINAQDGGGWTPIHLAAHGGSLSLVRTLLARGADPSIVNHDGDSPLDTALKQGHAEIAEVLRTYRATSTESRSTEE